jgi:threonine/homoserine/homoserine lactone efflux protein
MSTLSFFISSLIIVLMPGTGVIYTISTGITKGKKASIFAAFGCTAGIIPHLCLSIAISSLVFQINSSIFNVVKILGALYLLFLGIGMIADKSKLTVEGSQQDLNSATIVWKGILINLLNPKLTIFFFAFLPQYANTTNNSYAMQSLIFGIAFMILTLIVFVGYGILAGSAKKVIEKSPRIINFMHLKSI